MLTRHVQINIATLKEGPWWSPNTTDLPQRSTGMLSLVAEPNAGICKSSRSKTIWPGSRVPNPVVHPKKMPILYSRLRNWAWSRVATTIRRGASSLSTRARCSITSTRISSCMASMAWTRSKLTTSRASSVKLWTTSRRFQMFRVGR